MKIPWVAIIGATVGGTITLLVMLVSTVVWATGVESRVSMVEKDVQTIAEIRKDVREVRDIVITLPTYMERKDREDQRQWAAISELAPRKEG